MGIKERRPPPKKQKGQATKPRTLNGVVKDVSAMGKMLGTTDGKIRSAVARGLLPYRRWGKRLVFLTDEVDQFLHQLPGITVAEALNNHRRRMNDGGSDVDR